MMLPTTMLHCWDCIGQGDEQCLVVSTLPLRIKPKILSWSHQNQRILFVTILESFRCFSKLHAGFHCLALRRGFRRATLAIKPRLVEGCSDGWLSYNFLPSPECNLWSSATVIFGFFFTSLTKALLPPIAQFGWTASSRKGSGRPKRLPFKDYGGHCALRNLKCSRFFCNLGQICALPQFCLWALQAVPLTSWFSFALTCTVSCKVLYRQVCGFPNQVQSV